MALRSQLRADHILVLITSPILKINYLCNWSQTGHTGGSGGKMHTNDVRSHLE